MTFAPLYAYRPILNGEELVRYARAMGFVSTVSPDELHCTIAYSREPMVWPSTLAHDVVVTNRLGRRVAPLGDDGAVVLHFADSRIHGEWSWLRAVGASWDYEQFQPHVTLSYNALGTDPNRIPPYLGALHFGPMVMEEIELNPVFEEV